MYAARSSPATTASDQCRIAIGGNDGLGWTTAVMLGARDLQHPIPNPSAVAYGKFTGYVPMLLRFFT